MQHCPAVAAIVVHVPTAVALVHWFGLVGAGSAVLIMRSAHLLITIGARFFMKMKGMLLL